MIPHPTVRCFVSRAISADATVDERASMPCLRHHGYASASQIVSIPASSIARADASISSSGSMVSCMAPTRNGRATRLPRVFRGGRGPFGVLVVRLRRPRADALLGGARAGGRRATRVGVRRRAVVRRAGGRRGTAALALDRRLHLRVERREHVRYLLVHDRLQHALSHRADRTGDAHLGRPVHRAAALSVAQPKRRLHVQHRADAASADLQLRELGLALLDLVHVDLHLQPAEAEWDLHVRGPAAVVVYVEALHSGHRLRHRRGVVEHAPDVRPRRREGALAGDVHASVTCTRPPAPCGSLSISQTRWYGLALSQTIAPPLSRNASWIAAHTAWMPAPPPSPIPFVPSGVNGEGLST